MGFAAAEGLLGRRQVDRAEVVDPGQRVAGVDEVAEVPVAAAGEGRQAGATSARQRPPAARHDETEDENRGRQQEVELRPGRQARSQGRRREGTDAGAPASLPSLSPLRRLPAHALSAMATAASRKKMPTMSFRASPA